MAEHDPTRVISKDEQKEFGLPPLPETIGPYKIESLYKVGGMSLLYLAKRPATNETCIVKIILPQFLRSPEVVLRLVREAKILSIAAHQNIVTLYDLGRYENGLFVAMEFVPGISLRRFIQTSSFTHRRGLEIILQVAYALAHLHAQGVLHRDLKPDNVLLTDSGGIKLIDFGISELLITEDPDHITQKYGLMGTPNYMSPEQRDNPKKVSYPTDIFALGILTYESYLGLLCHGVVQIALLPRGLREIVQKAVALDPENRYQDVLDFISDLSLYMKTMDEAKEELSGEVYTLIERTRSVLLPKGAPKWLAANIGVAAQPGWGLESLYLDFFPSPTQLGIFLAEPRGSVSDALFRAAMLRGMARMEVKDRGPIQFLTHLNEVLCSDPAYGRFNAAFLLLDCLQNAFAYASCQLGSLWQYYPDKEPAVLEAPNPTLGEKPGWAIEAIQGNWNPGDLLLFSSLKMEPPAAKKLADPALLDPAILAQKALEAPFPSPRKKAAYIAISRL